MLDFLIFYGLIGVIISFIVNGTLWAMYRPLLTFTENLATIILWPTVISSFINSMNGAEEE